MASGTVWRFGSTSGDIDPWGFEKGAGSIVGTKPRILAGGLSAAQHSSGTGSLLTVHQDQMAKVASGLKLGGTISMYRLPVRGRTAH